MRGYGGGLALSVAPPAWPPRTAGRRDVADALALAAAVPVRTEPRDYPLNEANRALEELASGPVGAAAAALVPDAG